MQASAMMFLISEAEKYYNFYTIFAVSDLERSYETSLKFLSRSYLRAYASGLGR